MAKAGGRRKFGVSQKDRIFFAALPDAETSSRIYAVAGELKRDNGLLGNQILPEHLHVTLFHLGDWHELPLEIVRVASEAAARAAADTFDVAFKRAESFRNRTGIYPFVLSGDPAPWRKLRDALGGALKSAGLGGAVHEDDDFKPHVTLLRDAKRVKPIKVEPITWTVRGFVLVHSLLGKTTHIHLGRWPLSGG